LKGEEIMKMKKSIAVLAGIAVIFGIMGLFLADTADSSECRLIRIYAKHAQGEPTIWMEPENVTVKEGACIIWVNWGRAEVKVNFRDGKKCLDATTGQSGFDLKEKYPKVDTACYVTNWIPMGSTSSLTFTEPGVYKFAVEWGTGKDGHFANETFGSINVVQEY
jgi:hypothetical protein